MHHKYVVRNRERIWTGSMNWSQDSWSQENVIAIVHSPELAHACGLNFDELWETGDVIGSGHVEPQPVDVGGIEVRPWFTPEHGEALAHRIAKRIGQAKRRVRIASPVLSSARSSARSPRSARTGRSTSPASSTTRRSTASSTSGG